MSFRALIGPRLELFYVVQKTKRFVVPESRLLGAATALGTATACATPRSDHALHQLIARLDVLVLAVRHASEDPAAVRQVSTRLNSGRLVAELTRHLALLLRPFSARAIRPHAPVVERVDSSHALQRAREFRHLVWR